LTKAGAIQWKKTGEGEFTASFTRSSVGIGKVWLPDGSATTMWIYNEDGLLVARVSSEEISRYFEVDDEVKEFVLDPSELFSLVKNKVYKYSETTESILDELRKLKAS
jgi:hypothetical protein